MREKISKINKIGVIGGLDFNYTFLYHILGILKITLQMRVIFRLSAAEGSHPS
jgi:hypothetical protein